jgi:site-specific recombinase XerD
LTAPDNTTKGGRRDHSLLLFLYNTGARASEAAAVAVRDLDVRPDGSGSVRLVGKGTSLRALVQGGRQTRPFFASGAARPSLGLWSTRLSDGM